MSLADELEAEKPHRPTGVTEKWIADWYAGLDEADRETWDEWVADRTRSATTMFRVVQRHGFPSSCSGFDKWVRRQRDAC